MNQKAADLIREQARKAAEIWQVLDTMHLNPDDFQLTHSDETQIQKRQAEAQQLMEALQLHG